ncbi:hypothetical protein POTOM_014180 [Populus tomentosa]|uniref:peptidylprolyl isomerase n=1 Tax=Populus tomentosa TaxID=118781 RepID=A0A8X8A6A2_POPTO|nr:hypothetical protein POTOM_014180 [Populus tomentosa]
MPVRDAASWSAMITFYINNGFRDQGLSFFREMMANENPKPDQVTVGSVLSGCAHMGSLGLLAGKSVHGFVVKNGWELNVDIGTLLVDTYAKSQHGFCQEVLSLFKMMQEAGVRPNEMTFSGILNACARKGLIEEGRKYFKMIKETGLEPRIQHYGCMVDMFGKAGLLEEAYEVMKEMEFEPNIVIWGSFLSACKMHKQFDIADRVIGQVLRDIKPENDGGIYSLLSDLYVLNKKWDDAERVRNLVLNQNLRATAEEAPCELTVAPSGLAFFEKTVGTGPEAVKGQFIKAHYVGKLESGKIFDSSYNRGKPVTFRVGVGEACPYNFSKLDAVPVGGGGD